MTHSLGSRGVRECVLGGVLPTLVFGSGPPLMVLQGLTATHENPTGMARSLGVRLFVHHARHFTVHVVGRRIGIPEATTMADLARDVADAVRREFGGPVSVEGISTGGSIALELAVDHPDVVDRLVVASSACRLSEAARAAQLEIADLAMAGDTRRASAVLGRQITTHPAGSRALGVMMRALDVLATGDPTDMIRTIHAEDAFDVCDELHRIAAPSLVVGGERDGFYSPGLFRRTAEGIPRGELMLVPRKGHMAVLTDRDAIRKTLLFLSSRR